MEPEFIQGQEIRMYMRNNYNFTKDFVTNYSFWINFTTQLND